MTEYTVENIVVSAKIAESLDLLQVKDTFPDAVYNPEDVPAVILKKTLPEKAVVMLCADGTCVCTGLTVQQDAETLIWSTVKLLQAAEVPVNDQAVTLVESIVISTHLSTPINLKKTYKKLNYKTMEYDPKQFPGLIVQGENDRIVFLVLKTGKVVCTGPNTETVSPALEQFTNELVSLTIK